MNFSIKIEGRRFSFVVELFEVLRKLELELVVKLSTQQKLYRKSVNVCQFMNIPRSDVMLNLLFQDWSKHGFKVSKCPIHPVYNRFKYIIFIFINDLI